MRELVYLSDRKLEQFLPTLRSFWPRPKVNLKVPAVEIGVEPVLNAERDRLKHLARVIAHIERSARWFAEPDVTPGQWVHFEAPVNYLVIDCDGIDIVFFVDRNSATANYPTGSAIRLILHCSGTHLQARRQPARVDRPPGESVRISWSDASGAGAFSANNIELLLRRLRTQPPPSDGDYRPVPTAEARHLPTAVARLLRAIDGRVSPETAAWMAGYARITANFAAPGSHARYVIASPLYVEYATPPAVS